jgi:hypothetical protein
MFKLSPSESFNWLIFRTSPPPEHRQPAIKSILLNFGGSQDILKHLKNDCLIAGSNVNLFFLITISLLINSLDLKESTKAMYHIFQLLY